MYIKDYLKKLILLEQKLVDLFQKKGEKKFGKKYVYNTLAHDWIGTSEGTFLDHTNKKKYDFPGEDVPVEVEAMLRALKRYREMYRKFESGQIELSSLRCPEFQDLYDTIVARRNAESKKLSQR